MYGYFDEEIDVDVILGT
jgi:hypothetical protein